MSLFGWTFEFQDRVHLIWAALVMVAILAVLEVRSRDAMGQFLSPLMQRRLSARPSPERIAIRLALVLLALICGVIALMRPHARTAAEETIATDQSADVVFVLDVSKSMLAEDATPNRLARAKSLISNMVGGLSGERFGLVAFAGRAAPMCPLTADRAFFELVLSGVDTSSVDVGGTRIGDAVRVALRSFPKGIGAKLIVLITDGEDHESYPLDAAKAAQAEGAHIVAVGLGSEGGSEITLTDPRTRAKTVLTHDGKPVVSKLDGDTLRKMALATEGAYVPAGTAALDLKAILETRVKPIVGEAKRRSVKVYPPERYPWMVLACMVFLLAALWVGAGVDRPGVAR